MLEDKLAWLREATRYAYARIPFYRQLYAVEPVIESIEDFQALPFVTRQSLTQMASPDDFLCLDDEQLIMELNRFPESVDAIPFTPLENEYDMERRYRRIVSMLNCASATPSSTAIVCDTGTIYFAAEIERVLPWPLMLMLRSDVHVRSTEERLDAFGFETLILATPKPLARVPSSCRLLITFNSSAPAIAAMPDNCRRVDVCTLGALPWLAISEDGQRYSTLEDVAARNERGLPRFYLEIGPDGNLVVTLLHLATQPGAMSLIRYDTGIPVEEINCETFVVRSA